MRTVIVIIIALQNPFAMLQSICLFHFLSDRSIMVSVKCTNSVQHAAAAGFPAVLQCMFSFLLVKILIIKLEQLFGDSFCSSVLVFRAPIDHNIKAKSIKMLT